MPGPTPPPPPTPPTQLYGGTITTFATSMAEEIEKAYNALRNAYGLGDLPGDATRERRMLFIAIARGVITHLHDHQQAFQITVPVSGTTQTVTPAIGVRTEPDP